MITIITIVVLLTILTIYGIITRKGILKSYDTNICLYKDDHYLKGILTFEITVLYFIKYNKQIEIHVTMFNDYVSYKEHWQSLIDNKAVFKPSLIQNHIIFD
jgi:hypothetical protein